MSDAETVTDIELATLVGQLAARLRESERVLATAESCTGGWIGKVLTDLPGSSDWYAGGIVSYSNQAKQNLLSVPAAVLEQHGAVSEPVVRAMAEGARKQLGADLAVAVSGVAGPGGGTTEKPVGTVWIGWADASGTRSELQHFAGDREEVRRATIAAALKNLLGG